MKSFLVFWLMMMASPAAAVDFIVWNDASMTNANNNAGISDVVRIVHKGSAYTVGINPQSAGDDGNPLIYQPFNFDSIPTVPTVKVEVSWVTVRDIRCTGQITLGVDGTWTPGIELLNCTGLDRMEVLWLDRPFIRNNQIGDTCTTGSSDDLVLRGLLYPTIRSNRFLLGFAGSGQNNKRLINWGNHSGGTNPNSTMWFGSFDSNLVVMNFPASITPSNNDLSMIMYDTRYMTFMDNKWLTLQNYQGQFAMSWRSGTKGCTFTRDTILDAGTQKNDITVSGDVPVDSMTLDHCYIAIRGYIKIAWGSSGWNWNHNQIAIVNRSGTNETSVHAIQFILGIPGNARNWNFNHNSFLFYRGGSSADGLLFGAAEAVDISTFTFTENAVAQIQTSTGTSCASRKLLSEPDATASFPWDYNWFYRYGSNDSASVVAVGSSCGRVGPTSAACVTYGNECNGKWGGPNVSYAYTDTLYDPMNNKPNMRPASLSILHSQMWPDGYVGALPPKVTSPVTISVRDCDDAPLGRYVGMDISDVYDEIIIKYSTSPILTDAQFQAANTFNQSFMTGGVCALKALQTSGLQSWSEVDGFIAGSNYNHLWFSAKVRRGDSSWSTISDTAVIVNQSATVIDVPDADEPLTAISVVTNGESVLGPSFTFRAPDNALEYDVRISSVPITSANFDSQRRIRTGSPRQAGFLERVPIYIRCIDGIVYVAMKYRNAGGWSSVSNNVRLVCSGGSL